MTILLHRYRVFDYYGKLGRYCTFCRGGIFEKRESELSSRFRASTVPHRRYRLEPVFRTKLCKTGTQQVPSRVPRYYYILVSKGSGIGVLSKGTVLVHIYLYPDTVLEYSVVRGRSIYNNYVKKIRKGPVTVYSSTMVLNLVVKVLTPVLKVYCSKLGT